MTCMTSHAVLCTCVSATAKKRYLSPRRLNTTDSGSSDADADVRPLQHSAAK